MGDDQGDPPAPTAGHAAATTTATAADGATPEGAATASPTTRAAVLSRHLTPGGGVLLEWPGPSPARTYARVVEVLGRYAIVDWTGVRYTATGRVHPPAPGASEPRLVLATFEPWRADEPRPPRRQRRPKGGA